MDTIENMRTGKPQKCTRKLPKRVSKMSKEVLEATLRKKRECNNKALEIVQRLVENTVDENWFLDCLKFINDGHYQDVTEERAITKICGYPLCSKKLKDIPSQQYHISTKLNKVYDITERKNFCSNQCYKASTYLKRQLLTSPLWLREKEEIPKFLLLPVFSSGGALGEEVDIGQSNPLKEELKQVHKQINTGDFTSVSDFMKSSLSKLASAIDKAETKERKKDQEIITQNDQINMNKGGDIVKNQSTDEQNGHSNKEQSTTSQFHNEIKQNCEAGSEKISTENSISAVTQGSHESTIQNTGDSLLVNTVNNEDSYKEKTKSIHISEPTANNRDTAELNESQLDVNNCLKDKDTGEQNLNSTINNSEQPISNIKTENKLPSSKDTSVRKKQTKSKKNEESKKQSDFIHPMTSAVIHIEKCLLAWFTFESMCFLFGEEKMKEMVSDKGECIKEYYKAVQHASWDPKIQEQYMSICRRLNIMELEEEKLGNNTRKATKPLPDYTAIKEEGKKMELKIRAFFHGKTAYEDVDVNSNTDDAQPVLPIVDLHAQKCLRRKIVRDRLNRVVPDILRTLGLSYDVTKDIRNLVATFTLEAHNINFQPLEWNLISMIVIKMLSIRDVRLRILLDSEEVIKYVTMMLMVFQQDGGYLDRLMGWLTDLDNLLHKQAVNTF